MKEMSRESNSGNKSEVEDREQIVPRAIDPG